MTQDLRNVLKTLTEGWPTTAVDNLADIAVEMLREGIDSSQINDWISRIIGTTIGAETLAHTRVEEHDCTFWDDHPMSICSSDTSCILTYEEYLKGQG